MSNDNICLQLKYFSYVTAGDLVQCINNCDACHRAAPLAPRQPPEVYRSAMSHGGSHYGRISGVAGTSTSTQLEHQVNLGY